MPTNQMDSTNPTILSNDNSMFRSEELIEEHQETVVFHEEGEVSTVGNASRTAMQEYLLPGTDALANSVIGFLQRPIEAKFFAWKAEDAPLAELSSLDLPYEFFQKPMIKEKIAGFRYIRGDMHVRVQVNAQPFNAGRLIVWFEPFATNQSLEPDNVTHFGGITGYRHVDLDLSESTAVELTVPYICPLSHIDLVRSLGNMGVVHVQVYSALTGTTADIDGSVWFWMTNVDIQMPTGVPHTFESRKGVAQNKEVDAKAKPGAVTKLAGTVKSVASTLRSVPGLGSVMDQVSWVSDAVSGVSSLFGFSKPEDPNPPTSVWQTVNRHFTNFNGDSKSKVLALDARNSVVIPTECYDTTEDEMALRASVQMPTYLDRFSIDSTDPQNKIIWSWPVEPRACTKFHEPETNSVVFNNTMLSFISSLFYYWRGGINYHFKLIKTVFHSGRIRIFYAPGATLATDPLSIDISKCYNRVYDIRDLTSFDFTVPFVNNAPWLPFGDSDFSNVSLPVKNSYAYPTGMLYVEVLNSLRSPATAASKIEVLVETSGADDLQFAYPQLPVNLDIIYKYRPVENSRRGVAQNCEQFFGSPTGQTTAPNEIGIGEVVTSFRQILKRYDYLTNIELPSIRSVFPFAYGSLPISSSPSVEPLWHNFYEVISHIFRFRSGSVRLCIIPTNPIGESVLFEYSPPLDNGTVPSAPGVPSGTGSGEHSIPQVYLFPIQEGMLEVTCPFYQEFPCVLTGVGSPPNNNYNFTSDEVPSSAGGFITCLAENFSGTVFRSIGEDFSLGYLIGPPHYRVVLPA